VLDQTNSHANEIGFQPARTVAIYKTQVHTDQGFSLDRLSAREGNHYRNGGGRVA
jgi:hypothetical protein